MSDCLVPSCGAPATAEYADCSAPKGRLTLCDDHDAKLRAMPTSVTFDLYGGKLLCAYCPHCDTAWVGVAGEGLFHNCPAKPGERKVYVKRIFPRIVDMRKS